MIRMGTLAAALAIAPAMIHAEGRDTFREFVKEKGDAVIAIELVMNVKVSRGSQQSDSERKSEIIGFVIDEQGLLVTSLSQIDPGAFYSRFSGDEDSYVTRNKKITYLMPDNREIEATVVLRDPDLDLAFLKPMDAVEKPFVHISLDHSGDAQILDDVYTMSRMGRIARREIAAMSGEIQAIVQRPRKFYIPHSEITTAKTGAPVFLEDGRIIGMNGMYIFPGGSRSLGTSDEPVLFVIRPTADIAEVAAQARDIAPRPLEDAAAPAEETTTEETPLE